MAESSLHPQSTADLPQGAEPAPVCAQTHGFPCDRKRGKETHSSVSQWDNQLCPEHNSVSWGRVALSCHISLLDMGSVTVSPRGAAGQVRLSVCHKKLFSHRVLVCNNSSPKSLLPQLRSGIFSKQQTLHEVLGPAAGQGLGAAVSCPTTHPGEQRAEPWLHVQGAQSPGSAH